jgi:hypothetical protein
MSGEAFDAHQPRGLLARLLREGEVDAVDPSL